MAMTQAERDALDAKWEAERPMREWLEEIRATDSKMPRYLEDVVDALPDTQRQNIAAETLNSYNAKKEIRARKPE